MEKPQAYRLGAVLVGALMLTSCAATTVQPTAAVQAVPAFKAAAPEHAGPPDHAGPPTWAPAPDHAGPPSHAGPSQDPEPTEDPGLIFTTLTLYGLTFDVPEQWWVSSDCGAECSEYTEFEISDGAGNLVMVVQPSSARDTDGDLSTYQRQVLRDVPVPALDYKPVSLVSYFWSADDGRQDMAVALINDDNWQNRTEKPSIDFFQLNDATFPMVWMNPDYLQALGYDQDGVRTLEESQAFLASPEYELLERVMTSFRPTP